MHGGGSKAKVGTLRLFWGSLPLPKIFQKAFGFGFSLGYQHGGDMTRLGLRPKELPRSFATGL